MTPSARVQAAIEVVDAILGSQASADNLIAEWFRARRYAGSKDRRAIRELVYAAVRAFGERPASGRAALAALVEPGLFDGSAYGPAALGESEPHAVAKAMPDWLGALIPAEEHDALLGRAPLDVRVNALKATREEVLAELGGEAIGRDGVRIDPPVVIGARDGRFEVQDHGSQLVTQACRATPGMTVVDLCAGGGGKTLALAADMAGEGRLIACDIDRTRLQRLDPRASRAGARVETRLLDGGREGTQLGDLAGQADVVLVDAPCSGTGTLRRNPEARWRLTPAALGRLTGLQRHVLALAAPLVRPGGALVYAVCSLIDREGADQAAAFLARHPGWSAESPFAEGGERGAGRMLTPKRDATDGFFVARLRRA